MRSASESLLPHVLVAVAIATGGCARESGDGRGMPAASNWKPPAAQASRVESGRTGTGEGARLPEAEDDPHAGMDMTSGGDPHAGMEMTGGSDPHAGMDMGGDPHAGAAAGQDPHAGLDMGGGEEDPAMAAMSPPDPDRPIDASKFLRGTIRAGKEVEGAVRAGTVLFLSAWPVDPSTGELLGAPVAVARLDVGKLPMPFELSERDAMAAGTRFEGEVLITARVDGDGEARTKEPGDVEGRLRARIPASRLDLVLDTALR